MICDPIIAFWFQESPSTSHAWAKWRRWSTSECRKQKRWNAWSSMHSHITTTVLLTWASSVCAVHHTKARISSAISLCLIINTAVDHIGVSLPLSASDEKSGGSLRVSNYIDGAKKGKLNSLCCLLVLHTGRTVHCSFSRCVCVCIYMKWNKNSWVKIHTSALIFEDKNRRIESRKVCVHFQHRLLLVILSLYFVSGLIKSSERVQFVNSVEFIQQIFSSKATGKWPEKVEMLIKCDVWLES